MKLKLEIYPDRVERTIDGSWPHTHQGVHDDLAYYGQLVIEEARAKIGPAYYVASVVHDNEQDRFFAYAHPTSHDLPPVHRMELSEDMCMDTNPIWHEYVAPAQVYYNGRMMAYYDAHAKDW